MASGTCGSKHSVGVRSDSPRHEKAVSSAVKFQEKASPSLAKGSPVKGCTRVLAPEPSLDWVQYGSPGTAPESTLTQPSTRGS